MVFQWSTVRIVSDITVTNKLSTITVLFLILRLIRFLYKILFCREGNSADVFYIDYGETENIGEERICSNIKQEFLSLPSQALRCCIAGIRPVCIFVAIKVLAFQIFIFYYLLLKPHCNKCCLNDLYSNFVCKRLILNPIWTPITK